MKVLYNEVAVKIWSDGYSPIVFIKLLNSPNGDTEFNDILKVITKSIKAMHSLYKEVYVLLDLSECNVDHASAYLNNLFSKFSAPLSAHVNFLTVVPPKKGVELTGNYEQLPFKFHFCGSFFDALHYLNQIRVNQLTSAF